MLYLFWVSDVAFLDSSKRAFFFNFW